MSKEIRRETTGSGGRKGGGVSTKGLIFRWEEATHLSWVLGAVLVLSLCAHLAVFFLVQSVPPERVRLPSSAPGLVYVAPESPAGRALEAWLVAEDPALRFRFAEFEPPLQPSEYVLSYQTTNTPLRELPLEPMGANMALTQLMPRGGELERVATVENEAVPAKIPMVETVVRWDAILGKRAAEKASKLSIAPGGLVHACSFMIGVSREGEVRHLFLQSGSGDAVFDVAIERELRQMRFAAAEGETFGVAWIVPGSPEAIRGR